jgi:hypothetical protein
MQLSVRGFAPVTYLSLPHRSCALGFIPDVFYWELGGLWIRPLLEN